MKTHQKVTEVQAKIITDWSKRNNVSRNDLVKFILKNHTEIRNLVSAYYYIGSVDGVKLLDELTKLKNKTLDK